jgi:hypothetical protein
MKKQTSDYLRRFKKDLRRKDTCFWQDEYGVHCIYIKPGNFIPWEDAKRELRLSDGE